MTSFYIHVYIIDIGFVKYRVNTLFQDQINWLSYDIHLIDTYTHQFNVIPKYFVKLIIVLFPLPNSYREKRSLSFLTEFQIGYIVWLYTYRPWVN